MAHPLAAQNLEHRLMQHTIYIVFFDHGWTNSGSPTAVYPLQDAPTWPYIDLTQTNLAYNLGPVREDIDEMELFEPYLGLWLSTLRYPLKVSPMQAVYIRRMGVSVTGATLTKAGDAFVEFRKRLGGGGRTTAVERPREAQTHAPAAVVTAIVKREGAIPPPSPQPQSQPAAPAPQAALQSVNTLAAGRNIVPPNVLTVNYHYPPPGTGAAPLMRWPSGMFVCDVARGFELLSQGNSRSLEQRFNQVFPGYQYKASTYHDNRKFWRSLPVDVRIQAIQLPRTRESLWKVFRKSRPEWKVAMARG
ncbi:hypothetical protein H1R20_g12252, partial [Candolleomyces eurysporus]